MKMKYDIIGDIHGHYSDLLELLKSWGIANLNKDITTIQTGRPFS